MKTTIYELLGMIKDGNIPNRIITFGKIYNYLGDDYRYLDEDMNEHWLFSENYSNKTTWLNDFLSEEVTILETTIKPDLGTIICYKKGETDKAGYIGVVDKINEDGSVCLKQDDKIEKIDEILRIDDLTPPYGDNEYRMWKNIIIQKNRINKIIDRINNE